MTWEVEFDDRARKELRKLDHSAQQEILDYLRKRIATKSNPTSALPLSLANGKSFQGL